MNEQETAELAEELIKAGFDPEDVPRLSDQLRELAMIDMGTFAGASAIGEDDPDEEA